MDKWDSVIEVLSVNIQGGTGSSAPNITTLATNNSGDIQLSSSCIYLRGVAYLRKNNFDLAKSNLILALTVNITCFDVKKKRDWCGLFWWHYIHTHHSFSLNRHYQALQLLLENHMLSSVEEQELLNTLDYMNQLGSHGDFVKALYSTKLKKVLGGVRSTTGKCFSTHQLTIPSPSMVEQRK